MKNLYLNQAEQVLFGALSDELKEGWEIETEDVEFSDSNEKRIIRLSVIRLHDPKLVALRDKVQSAATAEEAAEIIRSEDIHNVQEDDLAELFFALGPTALSSIIYMALQEVSTDKDVERVTALTVIRHSLLTALTTSST